MKYTKESIINKIQEFYKNNNRVPTSRDFQKLPGYPGATTVQRHFGSWNGAIQAANLVVNTPTYVESYNKESIIALIHKYFNTYEKVPTTRDFDQNPDYPDSTTVTKYFQSWNAAIAIAGLSVYKKDAKYSDSELLTAIKDFYDKNQRVPNKRDFIRTEYPAYTTIVSRFGSWNTAILMAGFTPNTGCYGIKTKGLDSHNYRSAAEAYFCDRYLYGEYEYIIEPEYPAPYSKKLYDWYLPSLELYIELDGGLRPLVIEGKKKINTSLNRLCLFIPESKIYNKPNLQYFITALGGN